ncbi:disease resistance protein RPV1-like isoform X2 [Pyrus x bretschneideri]|uniref:disease resistance protein RPV1-like isoform X2 n=1 Tax=Pyrus x bretschneideri TaxID=225117 RepID=UPI00203000DF|nr:disease resistance protein RPV1-like isoform X2 [Pyrus x bretschneideri]
MDDIEANIPPHREKRHKQMDGIEANIPPRREKRHKQMDGIEANIPPRREKYDVFINFRGEDTRLGITSHLHAALLQKKIETYIDYRLQKGEEIGPALREAIEKSTHSVIIFSKDYASSTWCLDELVHILECKERYGQKVIPIFYKIKPSYVRKQHGSYAGAFAQLEKRFKDSIDKVHKWRAALKTAADLSGFDYSNKDGEKSEPPDGLDRLQNKLLSEILGEEGLSIGSIGVQNRLSRTKLLIVLDDVSSPIQMQLLAGDRLRYGNGGRIIITSRDRDTLRQTVKEDNIYEVKVLKPNDAFQLFCLHAFKDNTTRRTAYEELVKKTVDYARRVPLALTVLGSLFFNCKSKEDWEDEFNKLKQSPSEDIQKVLRISYDRLGKYEKEIFLDIACFHKGKKVNEVKRMLDVRGFFPTSGIRILIDRSLISIYSDKWKGEIIEMHDSLQEMGMTIVREQCIKDPNKRNRLFTNEDVHHVLKSNTETPIVEAIELSTYESEKQPLNFKLMSNLITLIGHTFGLLDNKSAASLDLPNSLRYLYWLGYSLESLPSKFSPENLVELHMPWSRVKKLWQEDQRLVNLQVIDLFHSMYLTEVPNLSGSLKIVTINLSGCESLVEIPGYFQDLDELTHLDLQGCRSLKYLPEMPRNIEYLDLSESGIKQLPQSVWSHEKISYLGTSSCRYLEKLPSNRCKLKVYGSFYINSCTSLGEFSELPRDINELSLVSCTRLVSLPTNVCKLKYLEGLNLSRCFKLENFPKILEPMEHLKSLNLSGTAVQELHSLIEFLPALKRLILKRCKRLSSVPKSICMLKYLEVLNLSGCCKFEDFPEILEPMEYLKYLNLRETAVQELHSLLEFLPALKILNLERCKRLSSIPKSICKLKYLEELNLSWCSILENFPEILEPMEHLKSLNLSGTAVQVLHSSVEFLPALKILKLRFCRSLSNIPKSICKLKYLEELDLSWCSKLENFPEILEPMEDLRCLKLCGTVVQELHLSGKFLPALQWNSLFSEAMEDFMELKSRFENH